MYSDNIVRAHIIMPTHFDTPHRSVTAGLKRATYASCNRCPKAVEMMMPVPKCFPMKNTMPGTRTPGSFCDRTGKHDAALEISYVPENFAMGHIPNRDTTKIPSMSHIRVPTQKASSFGECINAVESICSLQDGAEP